MEALVSACVLQCLCTFVINIEMQAIVGSICYIPTPHKGVRDTQLATQRPAWQVRRANSSCSSTTNASSLNTTREPTAVRPNCIHTYKNQRRHT